MTTSFTPEHIDQLKAEMQPLDLRTVSCGSPAACELMAAYCAFYHLPAPHDVPQVLGWVEANEFAIATHVWLPAEPRGTLFIVHGYYDHHGIYNHVVEYGLANHLAVMTFDLPGHGLSSGDRAAIDRFDQYGDVIHSLLTQAHDSLPGPWYAIGQSTGGAALLNYLWRYDALREHPLLDKTALCAPLILPRAWGVLRILYRMLHRIIKHLPRGKSRSSHDPAFIEFIDERDFLQAPQLDIRWVGAMREWDVQFSRFPKWNYPILVVQGDADTTVDWRYNLIELQRKLPKLQTVIVDDAGHQLVNEREDYRGEVFGAISAFFFST